MSEPTLMNPNPDQSDPASSDPPPTPDRFDPAKIHVVDVEGANGVVERFDCYDLGAEAEMFRLDGDEVQVCALDWARSDDMEATLDLRWTDTGLSVSKVDRIRVFDWPQGELIRVYKNPS